jgi:alpha-3'-ketoglucosidase
VKPMLNWLRGIIAVVVALSAAPLSVAAQKHNTLTGTELAEGWRLLFDGQTLDGWRGYNRPDMPDGWAVEDGTLTRVGPGGDIITDDDFADFELRVEWKISEGGNSGIFYRAAEGEEWIYHSAPEMQVLDDERHPDGRDLRTSAGSAYGLYPAPRGIVNPAGEWNSARIVVRDNHVEHWLNGTKIVAYTLGSDGWKGLVAKSKFAEWPAYGTAPRGHIGLQDHGDRVWYRDIAIREIS